MSRVMCMGRWALGLTLAWMSLGMFQVAQAADAIPAERRLGNDVVGFFSIRSIEDFKAAWHETNLGRMIEDPAMSDFIDQLGPIWEQASGQIDEHLGIPLSKILSVPQGEFAVAVVHSPGKPMGVIGLLDFGDSRETVDQLLEKFGDELTGSGGATRSEEEVDGTNLIVFTFEPDENEEEEEEDTPRKKKAAPATLVYCIKDSTLVMSSRLDVLKALLGRWDGEADRTFAEKQVYKYIREKCHGENPERDPLITLYLDPIGLFKGALALGGADPTFSAIALGFLPSLGVDKFKAIGVTMDMGTPEYDFVTRGLMYVEQPQTGIMGAFNFPPRDQLPAKWVPATVSGYSAVNWDIEGAYNSIEALIDTFQGAGSTANFIDQLAEDENGPKIHLKNDIIDQLTGQIIVLSRPRDKSNDDESNPLSVMSEEYVFGLEVKDEATFEKTVEKLKELPGFPGQTRDFEGEEIIDAGLDADAVVSPAGAVARKYLLIATHVGALEELLRDDENRPSLADEAAFKLIAEKYPEQTSTLSFQRADTQLRAIYETLKNGGLNEIADEEIPLDLSKLPDFDVIKKYLTPSGGYTIPDERGWYFMSFQLKPTASE